MAVLLMFLEVKARYAMVLATVLSGAYTEPFVGGFTKI